MVGRDWSGTAGDADGGTLGGAAARRVWATAPSASYTRRRSRSGVQRARDTGAGIGHGIGLCCQRAKGPFLPLLQRQAGRSFFWQPSPRVSPQSATIHQRNTRSSNIVRPRVEQRIRSIGAGSSTPREVSALRVQPPGANNARLSFRSPQRRSSDA